MIETNKYNMVFCDIKLSVVVMAKCRELGLNYSEADILCGGADGTISRIINKPSDNIKMQTFLAVVNGLDLDPRDYFELEAK